MKRMLSALRCPPALEAAVAVERAVRRASGVVLALVEPRGLLGGRYSWRSGGAPGSRRSYSESQAAMHGALQHKEHPLGYLKRPQARYAIPIKRAEAP